MRFKHLAFAAWGAALLGSATFSAQARDEHSEVVIEWNQILQETIPTTAALKSPRYYAMLHVAMFDAVNSIADDYSAFRVRVPSSRGASQEAAAAQAAHDVLAALLPEASERFNAALTATLAGIAPGRAAQGVYVGAGAAAAILAWRANDGWANPPLPTSWPLCQAIGSRRRRRFRSPPSRNFRRSNPSPY